MPAIGIATQQTPSSSSVSSVCRRRDGDHHGDNGDDADDGYRDDGDGDGNDDGDGDDADDDADDEQGSDGDRWGGERRRAHDMTTTLATIRNRIEDKRRDEDKRTLIQRISAAKGP